MIDKPVSLLWSRWIQVLSLFLIIYGIAMVFAPQMMGRTLVGPMFFNDNEPLLNAFVAAGEPQQTFHNVLNGLLGAVTAGWFVQTAWVARIPFRKGEKWAWNALALSISVWAVLEFYVKLASGITGLGLFAHFGLLIAFAVPLLATYRQIHSP